MRKLSNFTQSQRHTVNYNKLRENSLFSHIRVVLLGKLRVNGGNEGSRGNCSRTNAEGQKEGEILQGKALGRCYRARLTPTGQTL